MTRHARPSARATRLAKALEHPLRVELLFRFHRGETTPAEVARRLGEPLNLVSYHTRMLERMGCIELVRTERRQGAVAHVYRSIVDPVIDDEDWMRLPARARRALTLTSLDRMLRSTRRQALDGGFDFAEAQMARTRLVLDERGVREVTTALREALLRTFAREDDAAALSDDRRTYELVVLFFEDVSPRSPE
jgi:DNA-binding transcriptional ArsR family regulator